MDKQAEFLWAISTLNSFGIANLALDLDISQRHKISPAGRIEFMVHGLRASRCIPENISAEKAAHQFYYWHTSMYLDETPIAKPSWLTIELQFDFLRN